MRLRYEQLSAHLRNTLAPIYLISGDVPLLTQEARDAVRAAAQQRGYLDRQVFYVETGFNWLNLFAMTQTASLLSDKQLLELHLSTGQLNEAGSQFLRSYLERLFPEKILLISMGKLEAAAQRAAWFQDLTKHKESVLLQLWPLEGPQLSRWLVQRLAAVGLEAEAAGIQLLAERAEGNMLAAKQEIEKLHLQYGAGKLSTAAIVEAVSDNARFDVFALNDAALQGESKRVVRILASLQEEGVEPVIILWGLARELRSLAIQAQALAQGGTLDQVLQQVWEQRKPLVRNALRRHSVTLWWQLLQQAGKIDRMIKGVDKGNVWDALRGLVLAIAGTPLHA